MPLVDFYCYMATSSASGKDEANPVFCRLASRVSKMGPSCPLGISRFILAKAKFFGVIFCHIINPLLTMLVWSRGLDIGLVFFTGFKNIKRTWPISSHLDLILGPITHTSCHDDGKLNFD